MRRSKITAILAAITVLAMGTTVFAATESNGNWVASSADQVDVTVNATVGADFTVTIPKTVALANPDNGTGTWTATFTTTAKGDIGTNQQLKVKPAVEKFNLTSDAQTTAECSITAGKTAFERDELLGEGVSASHNLSAELTPGTWAGTFEFNIELGAKDN